MYTNRVTNSYFRLLHASPNAPVVDIYLNNALAVRNLAYRGFSQYLTVPPGIYNIKVYPSGQQNIPILDTSITIPERSIQTIAAIGIAPDISLLPVNEPAEPTLPDKVFLRFAHLSPNAPNVDVALPNNSILFNDVSYMEVANYTAVNPGNYTFYIRAAGTNQNVLYVPNINLKPNRFYTIYAVGIAGGNPPLQVLIPLDGNSYIKVY